MFLLRSRSRRPVAEQSRRKTSSYDRRKSSVGVAGASPAHDYTVVHGALFAAFGVLSLFWASGRDAMGIISTTRLML